MIETETDIIGCNDTSIYVLHHMLSAEQCEYFVREFDPVWRMQTISEYALWSKKLWEFTEHKFKDSWFANRKTGKTFQIIGFKDTITISKCRAPLNRHLDRQTGDEFKLFFYLTQHAKDAGTNFFDAYENKVEIKNQLGAGVLFDISLEHGSQPIPYGDLKISVGVRPVIRYR